MTTRKITSFLMKIYEFELTFKADNSGESVYETSNPAAGPEREPWRIVLPIVFDLPQNLLLLLSPQVQTMNKAFVMVKILLNPYYRLHTVKLVSDASLLYGKSAFGYIFYILLIGYFRAAVINLHPPDR
jgi:hypothetical protein